MPKIPTHKIENLTNSPYPVRMRAGYDRIVPAFDSIEDDPDPSFLEGLNSHFWKVTKLELTEEQIQALEAAEKAKQDRIDALAAEEAKIVRDAEEAALKAAADAEAEAAKKAENEKVTKK